MKTPFKVLLTTVFLPLAVHTSHAQIYPGVAEPSFLAGGIAAGAASMLMWNNKQRSRGLLQINDVYLDLTNRRICDLSRREYNRITNCKPGDVILMNVASPVLTRVLESCKLDEPVYMLDALIACVYEDHTDKFYRPKPVKKKE